MYIYIAAILHCTIIFYVSQVDFLTIWWRIVWQLMQTGPLTIYVQLISTHLNSDISKTSY